MLIIHLTSWRKLGLDIPWPRRGLGMLIRRQKAEYTEKILSPKTKSIHVNQQFHDVASVSKGVQRTLHVTAVDENK